MRIIVEHDDGARIDVTEGVQVCYDAATSSMDWGSGFLASDEIRAIQTLAIACGFDVEEYSFTECSGCGHEQSWHRMMTPSGYVYACQGRRDAPATAWRRGFEGSADIQCGCTQFRRDPLPTRDDLAKRSV